MEREMKKLLWVAVSVGIFLVVIIGAAILILTPKGQTGDSGFTSSRPVPAGRPQPSNADPSEMLRNSDNLMGIQPAPEVEIQETPRIVEVDTRNEDRVTINVRAPNTAAVPSTQTPAPAAPAAGSVQAAERSTTQTRPADQTRPAAQAAQQTQTSPAAQAAQTRPAAVPAAAANTRKRNDYWVQTGAFTAVIRAENAKETLASKGITSIIENRHVDGTTWYRVRVGPYTTESEANYWLALVQSIDGFAESQIRQTPSVR
jgi:DedD protein